MKCRLILLGIALFFSGFSRLWAEKPEGMVFDREAWEKYHYSKRFPDATPKPHIEPVEWSENTWSQLEFYGIAFSIILVILVIVFLWRMQKNRERGLRAISNRVEASSLEEAEENLPDLALNQLLQEVLAQEDYRSALRVRFLMLLQALIDAQWIEWARFKTNFAYAQSLKNTTIRRGFILLIQQFDAIWYGHQMPDQATYLKIDQAIEQLLLQIPAVHGQK